MENSQFPPYQPEPDLQLAGDLMGLTEEWQKLGIDPDDFLKCGECGKWIRDLVSAEDETMKDGTFLPGIPDEECCQCDD